MKTTLTQMVADALREAAEHEEDPELAAALRTKARWLATGEGDQQWLEQ